MINDMHDRTSSIWICLSHIGYVVSGQNYREYLLLFCELLNRDLVSVGHNICTIYMGLITMIAIE